MKDDRRPQEDAGQTACETEVSQIHRDKCAVGHHADERWTWPAGDAQSNQGNAGHARCRYCYASKLLAEQQLPDEPISNANPVAVSPIAAKISAFFIWPDFTQSLALAILSVTAGSR